MYTESRQPPPSATPPVDAPPSAERLQRWLRSIGTTVRQQLQYHWVALAILLAVCAVVQYAILHTPFQPAYTFDSREYMAALKHITQGNLFDPKRPPGYPLFLGLVFIVAGWGNYLAVVYAQAALMVLTIGEIYLLGYQLTRRRWLALATAAAVGLNIELINCERTILSESLSLWAVVTLALLLTRFLQTRRRRDLAAFAVMAVITILVRPAFIFVPLLFIVLEGARAVRLREVPIRWRTLLFSFVAIYGCIVLYVLGNAWTYGYFGFTYVSDVNLFGKVMEYRMWEGVSDPATQKIRDDISTYVRVDHFDQPWSFPDIFPNAGYSSNFYAPMGSFSHTVILHHPLGFLKASVPDVKATLTEPVGSLVVFPAHARLAQFLDAGAGNETAWPYLSLIPLAVVLLVRVVRSPQRTDLFILLSLSLAALANVLLIGVTDYTSFGRVRAPLDWAATFVAVIALGVLGEQLVRLVRTRLGATNTPAPVQVAAHPAANQPPASQP